MKPGTKVIDKDGVTWIRMADNRDRHLEDFYFNPETGHYKHKSHIKILPFSMLLDKNSTELDYQVRDLDQWSDKDLKSLLEMVKGEIKERKR